VGMMAGECRGRRRKEAGAAPNELWPRSRWGPKGVVTASRIHQQAVLIQDRTGHFWMRRESGPTRAAAWPIGRDTVCRLGVGESPYPVALISERALNQCSNKNIGRSGVAGNVVGAHSSKLPPGAGMCPAPWFLNVEVNAVERTPRSGIIRGSTRGIRAALQGLDQALQDHDQSGVGLSRRKPGARAKGNLRAGWHFEPALAPRLRSGFLASSISSSERQVERSQQARALTTDREVLQATFRSWFAEQLLAPTWASKPLRAAGLVAPPRVKKRKPLGL